MDSAACFDHITVVKWLHENRTEGCTTKAMDYAAQNGYLQVIQWLHINRTEGCTVHAMAYAARGGNLEVIQWLHDNRTEGCTAEAMDFAAIHGHLKIVQWLYEYRKEGTIANGMNIAILNGYVEMSQFLQAKCQAKFTHDLMEQVAPDGNVAMFKWMYENRSEPFSPNLQNWFEQDYDSFKSILKCMALYTEPECIGEIVDMLIEADDFGTAEVVICRACSRGVNSLGSLYVDFF